MKATEPIWTQTPETASRVRGRIEAISDWAAGRGFRSGENPARWRGHLDKLLPKKTKVRRVEHHSALPFAEIGAFMAELREEKGIDARVLEFAIPTAARTGEAIGARWDEIDFAERLWTIPAARIKASTVDPVRRGGSCRRHRARSGPGRRSRRPAHAGSGAAASKFAAKRGELMDRPGSPGSHPHSDRPNWQPATTIDDYLRNCREGLEEYPDRRAAKAPST
jgi:integrase